MLALEQARHSLLHLGLDQAAAVVERRLEVAAQRQLPYAEFLADLLGTEAAARRERYLRTRTRPAHLPFQRTRDQFDFRFQPSLDDRQVRELATFTFVGEAANVLLLGPPGVDKTHLAVALGLQAIKAGRGVYFVRAATRLAWKPCCATWTDWGSTTSWLPVTWSTWVLAMTASSTCWLTAMRMIRGNQEQELVATWGTTSSATRARAPCAPGRLA